MSTIPRILAIDDDLLWLEQVPLIFDERVHVETASSIDSAMKMIESQFYDVILLDLNFANSFAHPFRRARGASRVHQIEWRHGIGADFGAVPADC